MTYSQVLGIRVWTSLGRHLACCTLLAENGNPESLELGPSRMHTRVTGSEKPRAGRRKTAGHRRRRPERPRGPRRSPDGLCRSSSRCFEAGGPPCAALAYPHSTPSHDSSSFQWVHVSCSQLVPSWNSCQRPGMFLFLCFVSPSAQEMLMHSQISD